MSLTPTEQDELDALELEELEAEAAIAQPVAQPAQERSAWNNDVPVPTGFGGTVNVNPAQVAQTVKNMGLEGGGAALGQIVGAPFEAVGGMHIGGAVGGFLGNAAAQLTTPGKKFSLGEAGAAAAAGTIPGASLAKAGAKTVLKQGAKYAGANLLGKAVQTGVDEKRLPTLGEGALAAGAGFAGAPLGKYLDKGLRAEASRIARSQDSLRRETLKAGRELGLIVPPAVTAPNAVNNTLQSVAGKAATAQEAIIRNQPKVNAAVRAEIGLPADAPLTPIALNTARVNPNMVYEEVANLTPATAGLLKRFKDATAEANIARQAYRASIDSGKRNPALLEAAQAANGVAEQMRVAIGNEAKSPGANTRNAVDIMERFDAARTKLAQIGLAERAVNKGSGDVDAAVIGQALDHGEKLTGNFAKIGKFQNAFGKYVQDAANTPPSGVDYLKFVGKLGVGGGLGYSFGGWPGMVAGGAAMHASEKGARTAILSPFYQRSSIAQPFYGAATEDIPATVGRLGLASVGRDAVEPLPPVDMDAPLTEEEMKRYEELKAKFSKK